MNRLLYSLLCCLLLIQSAYGQKVKYKDLFVLLNARQFDQAEPFLKKYLKDNDDNPNAHLFMGQIYQERSLKADVLKESGDCKRLADSAVFFYGLAFKGITEKEIKKNDEYYQSYSRRDLRTGEFGIKLSDIQLDLEKRIQTMKDRGAKVTQLNSQFVRIESAYAKTIKAFSEVQAAYPASREMLLQSDEKLVTNLHHLADLFDSTVHHFSQYKTTLTSMGKTGYNQSLSFQEIKDLKTNLGPLPDFYADDVKLHDFKKWALGTIEIIDRDVVPLRKELIAYDIEINKLAEKVRKDSVSVVGDMKGIEQKLTINPVAKFDPAPMPLEVFKMKLAELRYASLRVENKKLRDSSDLIVKVKALEREWKTIAAADSISGSLMQRNLDEEVANYQHFVTNAYGTMAVLKSLIKATHEYAIVEKSKREQAVKRAKASLDWLVIQNDSIPLIQGHEGKGNIRPLLINDQLTIGLRYEQDTVATGYLYTITPSRVPDVKVSYPVDVISFAKRNLPVTKALSRSDSKGQVFYALIYSETKTGEKYPATIAKIYRTDGLSWSNNYQFDFLPSELIINTETGELSVKTTSASGENKLVIVDKNGKLLP